ncbi:MAG: BBP7 family outer membrane beta-barrel protein [Pirellulales bacterium]
MRYQLAKVVAASGLWLAVLAHGGRAQFQMPAGGPSGPSTYEQDADLFAPAEMDIDGMTIGLEDRGGYFFNFDKLLWSVEGELITVGNKEVGGRPLPPVWADHFGFFLLNPQTLAPIIAQQPIDPVTGRPINPDTRLPIERPFVINSLQETRPDASFRAADRIEFGFNSGGNGWLVGILQGPKQQQSQLYGTNGGAQEDSLPNPGLNQGPFGDVYIAFDYQPGLMHGFVDVIDGVLGTGRVLPNDLNGDNILEGDGIADDMDADSQYGPDGFDLVAPGNIPDTVVLGFETPDYDDLVEFPTSFRTVLVRNTTTVHGIEVMRTYRLDNNYFMAKNQNRNAYLYYGVRYMRFRDNFVVDTEGGVLGQCLWNTQIINNIVGPQVGLNWTQQRGRWRGDINGRFTFGYNLSNWDQEGFIGEDLIAGRHNHPLYLQTHSFKYGRQDHQFSPLAEMRLGVAYQVTKAMAINAGWTGSYVGNVFRASTHVKYELPNMGFTALEDAQHVIINGGNLGLEFNY